MEDPPDAVKYDEQLKNPDRDGGAGTPTSHLANTLRLLHDVLRRESPNQTAVDSHSPDPDPDESLKRSREELLKLQHWVPSRFRIHRLLGKGGFGVVCLATDSLLNRDVAIKIPHAPIFQSDDLQARFLRECRAVAKLDHPGIVRVLDCGDLQGMPYQVAEFVDGESLRDFLRRRKLSTTASALLIRKLADAVHHAHDNGVLHRDIKPDNILLQRPNESHDSAIDDLNAANESGIDAALQPRLTDFGLARLVDDDILLSRSGLLVGTPKYMSPEQLLGLTKSHGPATDIYSLGVVLHELLTGDVPFPEAANLNSRIAIAEQEVRPFASSRKEIPAELQHICLRCLKVNSQSRYSSAEELSRALQSFIEGSPGRQAQRSSRRLFWQVTCGASAALAAFKIAATVVPKLRNNTQQQRDTAGSQTVATKTAHTSSLEGREFQSGGPILTAPVQVNVSSPLTIEAWVKPQRPAGIFVYASGLAVSIQEHDSRFCLAVNLSPDEDSNIVVFTPQVVQENEWNHLAVVVADKKLRLFVNGKLCATEWVFEDDEGLRELPPGTLISSVETYPGAAMVIGSNSIDSKPKHRYPYSGRIRSVRISNTSLYSEDFKPEISFSAQAETYALYNLSDLADSVRDEAGKASPAVVLKLSP